MDCSAAVQCSGAVRCSAARGSCVSAAGQLLCRRSADICRALAGSTAKLAGHAALHCTALGPLTTLLWTRYRCCCHNYCAVCTQVRPAANSVTAVQWYTVASTVVGARPLALLHGIESTALQLLPYSVTLPSHHSFECSAQNIVIIIERSGSADSAALQHCSTPLPP